jgi:CRISPR-associated endoribonuclease Cas6
VSSNGTIRLGRGEFVLLNAGMEAPYGGAADFHDLLADRGSSAELYFASPTTFRRRGLNVPLPDPQLVYGSLWQKWDAFSDVRVPESTYEEMAQALAVSQARVLTRTWKYPRFMLTGFTGRVRFDLVRRVSVEAARLFGGLSALAFYSGVGYRTTMGMGQCRLLEQEGV